MSDRTFFSVQCEDVPGEDELQRYVWDSGPACMAKSHHQRGVKRTLVSPLEGGKTHTSLTTRGG